MKKLLLLISLLCPSLGLAGGKSDTLSIGTITFQLDGTVLTSTNQFKNNGYAVEPATKTFLLDSGVRASTGVFTSTVTAPYVSVSTISTYLVRWADGTTSTTSSMGTGSGGGATIYYATSTAGFPYGFSASTATIGTIVTVGETVVTVASETYTGTDLPFGNNYTCGMAFQWGDFVTIYPYKNTVDGRVYGTGTYYQFTTSSHPPPYRPSRTWTPVSGADGYSLYWGYFEAGPYCPFGYFGTIDTATTTYTVLSLDEFTAGAPNTSITSPHNLGHFTVIGNSTFTGKVGLQEIIFGDNTVLTSTNQFSTPWPLLAPSAPVEYPSYSFASEPGSGLTLDSPGRLMLGYASRLDILSSAGSYQPSVAMVNDPGNSFFEADVNSNLKFYMLEPDSNFTFESNNVPVLEMNSSTAIFKAPVLFNALPGTQSYEKVYSEFDGFNEKLIHRLHIGHNGGFGGNYRISITTDDVNESSSFTLSDGSVDSFGYGGIGALNYYNGKDQFQIGNGGYLVNTNEIVYGPRIGDTDLIRSTMTFSSNRDGNVYSLTFPLLSSNANFTFPPTNGSSGQFLKTDGSGVTSWDTPAGGSGGSSILAVKKNGVQVSSPTAVINFSNAFNATLTGGATAFIEIDYSSMSSTLLSWSSASATYFPLISSTTLLMTSSATANYLTLSSASATYFVKTSSVTLLTTSSATATYLQLSSASVTYFVNTSSITLLTTSSATANYLTLSSAAATYFQINSTTTLLTTSSATANYLTLSSAIATYMTPSSTTANYLKLSSASATYFYAVSSTTLLTTSSATANYLSLSSAAATYRNINALSGATAGSYTNSNITVNAQGLITLASNGTAGGGGASTLSVGTGTAANYTNNITSPTAVISFLGSQFMSIANGATNFISIAGGSFTYSTATIKTSSYSMVNCSEMIIGSTTAAGFTVYLSTASLCGGYTSTVKKGGFNTSKILTVKPQNVSNMIDGYDSFSWTTDMRSYDFVSDGTNWFVK